jgi:chromosome segregation protein
MKIKSIELSGFKSFSDRAVLNFQPGITSLVGPNGCGKSNVVDAFRWALGEQSAKQLRGSTMEDVIFNGSETRKPTSLAEVSITFSNEDGQAPVHFSNYSEIMVTRRLFRSGESEYSINKIPCRLKDITDLFLDTGAGAKAYSIIEQGKVEQIINAKPFDRRVLIDEVAGISKYKNRKREALSKIESTNNNLHRVDDIIVEVKRQLNSIKRQAGKLKRYQTLKDEIKKIEIQSSLAHYASLKDNHQALQSTLDQSAREEIKLTAQTSSIEAAFEKERFHLNQDEKLYQSIQEEIYKITSTSQKEESRAEYLAKELLSAENQYHQHVHNSETIDKRIESLSHEEHTHEERNAEHQKTIKEGTADLLRKEEHLTTLKHEFSTLQTHIETEKNNLIDVLTELTHVNNQLAQMEKNHLSLLRKIEYNKEESENMRARQTRMQDDLSHLKDELAKTEATKTDHQDEKSTIETTIVTVTEELHHTEEALTAIREKCEKADSRLVSLQELQDKFEECDAGVRSIMLRTKQEQTASNGIYGLLADYIQTEPQYETALEAVLGDKLHYIVVESHLSGIEALDYLKMQSLGRASIIPLQIRNNHLASPPPGFEGEHVKPLLQLVTTTEEYRTITEHLLSDVLLVDNFNTAMQMWNSNGHKFTLVTQEGEIIDPAGIITGGRQNGTPSKILSKRREIKELQIKLSELMPQYEDLYTKKTHLTSRLSQLRENSETLKEEVHQRELTILSLKRDINQATREIDEASQRIELFTIEKGEFSAALQQASDETVSLQDERERTLALKKEKEALLEQLQEQQKRFTLQIDSLHNETTTLKIQVAADQEKFENNILTLKRIRENLSELKEEHSTALTKSEELQQNHSALEQELLTTQEHIEEYHTAQQELESSIDSVRSAIVLKEESMKEKEDSLKQLRRSREEEKAKINDITVKIAESKLTITHLLQDIQDKYHLNLDTLLHEAPPEVTREDTPAYDRLEELKEKIERLGEVNLGAAQEEEELSSRYQFLSEQRDDLMKSLESLNDAIKKINRTTKQRFVETFHLINDKFKTVFPELFQGGKAELTLTDESNILETGIEIVAQPPGKKLQRIDLLSGGEKSLTAFALLMAIFLVKPSPFCLLDEADSAFDDLNAVRFNQYLQNISHDSQFILITHNKLSMQAAHTLYGITMQEPGASKVVSVQLQ